jgi:hypothetical protein
LSVNSGRNQNKISHEKRFEKLMNKTVIIRQRKPEEVQ